MTEPRAAQSPRSRVIGYLSALGAGATWGTTGPLSTGLYGLMPATSIGFWRVLIGTVALAIWGIVFRRDMFRADRRGWLIVGLGGGAMVALFEIAYQYAIAGVGVAGAKEYAGASEASLVVAWGIGWADEPAGDATGAVHRQALRP